MKQHAEATKLVREIRSLLRTFPDANTAALRAIRREISNDIKDATPDTVLQAAALLLQERTDRIRFVVYELVSCHKQAFASLDTTVLLKLGKGLNSWSSVDCFALYLCGPVWLKGRIPDRAIITWAESKDRWWRRAALVSTVALSRRGQTTDIDKIVGVCALARADRDDMVVKALSWALRELAKKHPKQVHGFLAEHRKVLAARVIREVENKLTTGLKSPRRSAREPLSSD
jgi:3-methyladenine DNA glycosylase AlkD